MKDGNSFPIEPICKLRDPLAPQVVGVEGGTLQQAAENMQIRRGEAQRVQQRQTIRRSDAQRLRIGVGKVEEVAMRLNDALRLAGRPGGVIDIGRRLARNRRQRPSFVTLLPALDVDDGAAGGGNGMRAILQSAFGEQRDRFAVPQYEAQPFFGIACVQRDIGVGAFASAENGLDRTKLALEEEANNARTSSARGHDLPRNRGRLRIELSEADPGFSFDNRDVGGQTVRDSRQPYAYGVRHGS